MNLRWSICHQRNADVLSRLIPKFKGPFEEPVIASLISEDEIFWRNTIKELTMTLDETKIK